MTKNLQFPAGTPITFTSGAYSDFGICGQVVTIEDCDLPALAQEFRAEKNPEGKEYSDNFDEFVAWLVVRGKAMPMSGDTVHLGDYLTFDSAIVPTR